MYMGVFGEILGVFGVTTKGLGYKRPWLQRAVVTKGSTHNCQKKRVKLNFFVTESGLCIGWSRRGPAPKALGSNSKTHLKSRYFATLRTSKGGAMM